MINKKNWAIWVIVIIVIAIICTGCCNSVPVKEIVYVPVQDTVTEQTNIAKIVRLEHELRLTRDSLANVRDSIGEDLMVARIKLARIKEYNSIAAKGNNIKYLRGWINRVLEN